MNSLDDLCGTSGSKRCSARRTFPILQQLKQSDPAFAQRVAPLDARETVHLLQSGLLEKDWLHKKCVYLYWRFDCPKKRHCRDREFLLSCDRDTCECAEEYFPILPENRGKMQEKRRILARPMPCEDCVPSWSGNYSVWSGLNKDPPMLSARRNKSRCRMRPEQQTEANTPANRAAEFQQAHGFDPLSPLTEAWQALPLDPGTLDAIDQSLQPNTLLGVASRGNSLRPHDALSIRTLSSQPSFASERADTEDLNLLRPPAAHESSKRAHSKGGLSSTSRSSGERRGRHHKGAKKTRRDSESSSEMSSNNQDDSEDEESRHSANRAPRAGSRGRRSASQESRSSRSRSRAVERTERSLGRIPEVELSRPEPARAYVPLPSPGHCAILRTIWYGCADRDGCKYNHYISACKRHRDAIAATGAIQVCHTCELRPEHTQQEREVMYDSPCPNHRYMSMDDVLRVRAGSQSMDNPGVDDTKNRFIQLSVAYWHDDTTEVQKTAWRKAYAKMAKLLNHAALHRATQIEHLAEMYALANNYEHLRKAMALVNHYPAAMTPATSAKREQRRQRLRDGSRSRSRSRSRGRDEQRARSTSRASSTRSEARGQSDTSMHRRMLALISEAFDDPQNSRPSIPAAIHVPVPRRQGCIVLRTVWPECIGIKACTYDHYIPVCDQYKPWDLDAPVSTRPNTHTCFACVGRSLQKEFTAGAARALVELPGGPCPNHAFCSRDRFKNRRDGRLTEETTEKYARKEKWNFLSISNLYPHKNATPVQKAQALQQFARFSKELEHNLLRADIQAKLMEYFLQVAWTFEDLRSAMVPIQIHLPPVGPLERRHTQPRSSSQSRSSQQQRPAIPQQARIPSQSSSAASGTRPAAPAQPAPISQKKAGKAPETDAQRRARKAAEEKKKKEKEQQERAKGRDPRDKNKKQDPPRPSGGGIWIRK